MQILAIDPGSEKSAYVIFDTNGDKLISHGIEKNDSFDLVFQAAQIIGVKVMAIEYPFPRGECMYTQLVDTICWIGRFEEKAETSYEYRGITRINRKDVKMVLCGNTRAKDKNIRAALISRFSDVKVLGGGKNPAIGTKQKPGPLYGVSKDVWAALAIAVTFKELFEKAQDIF